MTATTNSYGMLVHISGTIAEVCNEISELDLVGCIKFYTDDGTNAKALCSRRK